MAREHIPYSTQDIDDNDIAAVVAVLKSSFITQGPAIERFEAGLADYCGVEHAVAVSNGTAGLHVALAALGIGPGSLVWTSPNSFVASANAARFLGADVDFVDIDVESGNVNPRTLEAKLETAAAAGRLPDTFIPVHFAGRACDMQGLESLCRRHGITIVEDAAHALGADYADGGKVGNARHGAATVFSFHPVKSMTTGEGGMITTRDGALAQAMRRYRSHGVTRDPCEFVAANGTDGAGAWYYEQRHLGFNYRITDIQAALGASQLGRLDSFIRQRREVAARYARMLADAPLHLPPESNQSAWHLYAVRLSQDSPVGRKEVFEAMRAANIGVNVHYIPIHLQPYYRELGFRAGDFPGAEAFYAGAISLPLYPSLRRDDQEFVVETLGRALGA